MQNSELISVIVPVYNLEGEISKCLLSLVLQKYPNFEVIIVDDGSTDNSLSVCSKLAEKDKRFLVYHTKNKGLSSARNFGISKAKGKYLAFVDGDDYIDPEFLSSLYSSVLQSGSDIAISGYTEIYKNNSKTFLRELEVISGRNATIRLLTRQENMEVLTWNKLYKKTLFRGIRFPDGKNHEDNFTTFQLLIRAKKVSYVSKSIYSYVYRESSITNSEKTLERLKAKVESAKEAMRIFKKEEKDSRLYLAAKYSELLAFLQFVDFSAKGEIPKKYFKIYRKKILKNKAEYFRNPYIDFKRQNYIRLLSSTNGFLYYSFRKFI